MYEHTYIYTHAHNLWEQASKGGSRFTMRSEPESRFTVQLLCCLGQMAQSLCLHSFLRHCIPGLLEHLRERGFYGQCACRPGDRRQHFQSGDRQSLLLGKQSEANKEGILNQKIKECSGQAMFHRVTRAHGQTPRGRLFPFECPGLMIHQSV